MDIFLCVLIFVVSLYVTKLLWCLYITSSRDASSSLPLPPGGVGLPFIGEMLDMVLTAYRGRDFFSERRLQFGAVYKTHVMGRPTVRVVGAAHIRRVLQADAKTADMRIPATVQRLLGPNALANSMGHQHRVQKKIVLKAFTTQALSGYAMALDRLIKDEISDWTGRHCAFDLMEHVSTRAAWEVLVGLRNFKESRTMLVKDFETYLNGFWTLPISIPGTAFHKAKAANQRLSNLILQEYNRRMSKTFEHLDFHDALSLILAAGEETQSWSPLVESEVVDVMKEMLFAGHSTTASAATSVVMYLGLYPHVLTKLRKELEEHDLLDDLAEVTYEKVTCLTYLGDVINETLRLAPPAGGGFRTALKTMEIGGYQIPEGWTIIWSAFDTHEVSELFDDSRQEFRPERWAELRSNPNLPYNYVPFGAGPRACVGKDYAKLLLRILTVHLVRQFDWELENTDITMVRLPVRRPKDRLPVVFRIKQCSVSSTHTGNNNDVYETNNNETKNSKSKTL